MNLKEFVEANEELFRGEVTPYLIYEGDKTFRKKLFGFEQIKPIYRDELLPYDHKAVRDTLKRNKIKLKRGDKFIARTTESGKTEVIPGEGIVCGNLNGKREQWDEETLAFLLGQDNVEALLFVGEGFSVSLPARASGSDD